MKIAVNTRFLIKDKMEGIGYFTHETVKRMVKLHPEHQFFFLFDRLYDNSFIVGDNITPVVIPPPARHPFLWYYWFEFALPKYLKRINPDCFISPDSFLSLKSNIKTILVVHDLAFENDLVTLPYITKRYYKSFFPKYIKKADRIATVSNFSKQDIINKYKCNADKIDVVFSAVKNGFKPIENCEKDIIKELYSMGHDYFVYVGLLEPRKNIVRIFKSFDMFKSQTDSKNKLVIAGRKGWGTEEIWDSYKSMNHKNDVVFTDYLPTKQLVKLIGASRALLFVSNFEGFGVPILEGMHCNVPVITSNVSSMPEIAGNAAYLVNPYSVEDIASAMQKIYYDPQLCSDLVEKGKKNRGKYSWDKTADLLWESMQKVIPDL